MITQPNKSSTATHKADAFKHQKHTAECGHQDNENHPIQLKWKHDKDIAECGNPHNEVHRIQFKWFKADKLPNAAIKITRHVNIHS